MKKIINSGLFVFTIGMMFLVSCGKKVESPTVSNWIKHNDPYMGFEIQYPEGWVVNADPKKMKIYSVQDAANAFYEIQNQLPISGEPKGVEIEFGSISFKDANLGTVEEFVAQEKTIFQGGEISNEKNIKMGKVEGLEFTFKAQLPDAKLGIRQIYVARDSVFYYLKYSGLNDYFDVYTNLFDTILQSIKLPRPKLKGNDDEIVKPSPDFTKFTNEYFEFNYPDNFETSSPSKKGETIFAVDLMGYRQDCTIQFDIMPAKGLSVEKAFEQNKGKFNANSEGSTTIDGNAGKFLNYSPVAKIDRRVYFVVKNDKLYRVFLTWYTPMANDFKPAFEKVISSLKIK